MNTHVKFEENLTKFVNGKINSTDTWGTVIYSPADV